MKKLMLACMTMGMMTSVFASVYPQNRDEAISQFESYFAQGICKDYVHTQEWDYFCGEDRYVYDDLRLIDGLWQIEVRADHYYNDYYTLNHDGQVIEERHYFE